LLPLQVIDDAPDDHRRRPAKKLDSGFCAARSPGMTSTQATPNSSFRTLRQRSGIQLCDPEFLAV
jgi:hypothetical protein